MDGGGHLYACVAGERGKKRSDLERREGRKQGPQALDSQVELSKSCDGKEDQMREGSGASGTEDGSWRVEPLCFLTSIYRLYYF